MAIILSSYKDRRSKTSVLTDLESSRLRTALYRIWQFCISCGNTEIEFELERDAICANSILNCASITCVERQIAGNTVCSGSDRTYSALRVNKVND